MIQENIYDEAEIRRFLLGEMSEDARSAFEERFVADENLFEQISAAEDELIESYLRATLSSDEKTKFERNFLATDSRRRRVAFTRTMLDKLSREKETVAVKKTGTANKNPSVRDLIIEFFKIPKFAFGTAFTLLVLIFGGWLLLKNSNQPEIVRQITPTPTGEIIKPNPNQNAATNQNDPANPNTNTAENIPGNKDALPNENRVTPNADQNLNKSKQIPVETAPTLALFAGMVRGEGKMPELNLPKNALGANLQLNLESQDYKIYSVEIVNPDGNLIFKNGRFKAKNSKINLFVPAQKLPTGEYMVKVSGLNPNNETESVADYSFRVNRK